MLETLERMPEWVAKSVVDMVLSNKSRYKYMQEKKSVVFYCFIAVLKTTNVEDAIFSRGVYVVGSTNFDVLTAIDSGCLKRL